MLEILYRIYKTLSKEEIEKRVKDSENNNSFSMYNSYSNSYNEEICMDCFLCESREDFKEHIKSIYGNDIHFANSKKYPPNTYYCIIIGEHCYNSERYFNKIEYECDFCHTKTIGYIDSKFTIDNYEIKTELANQLEKYQDKKFCCYRCKYRYIEHEKADIYKNADYDDSFITKDNFTNNLIDGYIYLITKKSTGEFYVGQTIYAPIFRWGQHLRTERFDIKNILDYTFETIEIVPKS